MKFEGRALLYTPSERLDSDYLTAGVWFVFRVRVHFWQTPRRQNGEDEENEYLPTDTISTSDKVSLFLPPMLS